MKNSVFLFFDAAMNGDIETIQRLILRVNVSAKNYDGQTALMIVADNDHEDIVVLLKKYGARR